MLLNQSMRFLIASGHFSLAKDKNKVRNPYSLEKSSIKTNRKDNLIQPFDHKCNSVEKAHALDSIHELLAGGHLSC